MDKIEKAKRRVEHKKGFYIHFGIFVLVMVFLFLINILTTPGLWWSIWPLLGWGLGVAIHYLVIFGIPGTDVLSSEWEERTLQKELYRLEQKPQKKEKEEKLELDNLEKVKRKEELWDEQDIV